MKLVSQVQELQQVRQIALRLSADQRPTSLAFYFNIQLLLSFVILSIVINSIFSKAISFKSESSKGKSDSSSEREWQSQRIVPLFQRGRGSRSGKPLRPTNSYIEQYRSYKQESRAKIEQRLLKLNFIIRNTKELIDILERRCPEDDDELDPPLAQCHTCR